jgi:hypothetical protein
MKLFKGSVDAFGRGIRQYEVSSERETAEIRGRLLGRIQARLRNPTSCCLDTKREMKSRWKSGRGISKIGSR